MRKRRFWLVVLSVVMALCMFMGIYGCGEKEQSSSNDIIILYTNDVHTHVDDTRATVKEGEKAELGYATVAAYREQMQEQYGKEYVTLVDCGDATQGSALGTLSNGAYPVQILNEVGYDIAIPGNHEFDYGIAQFFQNVARARYTVLCSNLIDLELGTSLLPAYEIKQYGNVKVGFVGVDTPESYTKSTPTYFQDKSGNYIYGFCNGNNGQDLYDNVQKSVDAVKAEGVNYVVLMGHLGIDEQSAPWRSTDVIANTKGIDVVLDGHSHSTIKSQKVSNKDGKDVILTSTGNYLNNIGKLTIKGNGEITTELVSEVTTNAEKGEYKRVNDIIKGIESKHDALLKKVVAKTDVNLTTKDAGGNRAVRNQETNLGDLCADAYLNVLGADIAFVNGGGIRADLPTGNITYEQIIAVHPYGNMACVIEATGEQILKALELGAASTPGESGGFLQVAGLEYTIDLNVDSTVQINENKEFVSVNLDSGRIKEVKVLDKTTGEYVPIDRTKTYKLASHNYMLKNGGDGYTMFKGATVLQDEVKIDNQVLIDYIVDILGGTVGSQYANPQGRITVIPKS